MAKLHTLQKTRSNTLFYIGKFPKLKIGLQVWQLLLQQENNVTHYTEAFTGLKGTFLTTDKSWTKSDR